MINNRFSIIFGLTADPIHLGHEQAIINGIEYLRQNKILINEFLLLPVYQPNLIADKKAPIVSYAHRFAMCTLVADRLSKQLGCVIKVSHIEKDLAESTGEKNYSYNTIRALKFKERDSVKQVPNCAGMTELGAGKTHFLFMLSADHFQGRWPKFRQWNKWQEILKHSGLLINQRPGNTINQHFIQQLRQINSDVYVVKNSKVIDVSSSKIRRQLGAKQAVDLLAPDILNYIKEYNLY